MKAASSAEIRGQDVNGVCCRSLFGGQRLDHQELVGLAGATYAALPQWGSGSCAVRRHQPVEGRTCPSLREMFLEDPTVIFFPFEELLGWL